MSVTEAGPESTPPSEQLASAQEAEDVPPATLAAPPKVSIVEETPEAAAAGAGSVGETVETVPAPPVVPPSSQAADGQPFTSRSSAGEVEGAPVSPPAATEPVAEPAEGVSLPLRQLEVVAGVVLLALAAFGTWAGRRNRTWAR